MYTYKHIYDTLPGARGHEGHQHREDVGGQVSHLVRVYTDRSVRVLVDKRLVLSIGIDRMVTVYTRCILK